MPSKQVYFDEVYKNLKSSKTKIEHRNFKKFKNFNFITTNSTKTVF